VRHASSSSSGCVVVVVVVVVGSIVVVTRTADAVSFVVSLVAKTGKRTACK